MVDFREGRFVLGKPIYSRMFLSTSF